MSSQKIKPADLSKAISSTLEMYSEDVQKRVDKAGKKAVDELVRITKDTAPFDTKKHGKHYVNYIAADTRKTRYAGKVYTWYVKKPMYRLTHLLVHGHMDRSGRKRIAGNPFLHNAWNKVRPQYEHDVEEAIKDAGR